MLKWTFRPVPNCDGACENENFLFKYSNSSRVGLPVKDLHWGLFAPCGLCTFNRLVISYDEVTRNLKECKEMRFSKFTVWYQVQSKEEMWENL